MNYPASKDDLISTAEANGAPDEVISGLQAADADQFEGPDDVVKALR